MKYATYYEATKLMTLEDTRKLEQRLEEENGEGRKSIVAVRKVNFIIDGGNPSYCICMKDNNTDTLLLAKRAVQNTVTYRSYAEITKEQSMMILAGNVEWMKDSKVELFKDFYLQYSFNRARQGYIEESLREVIVYNNKHTLLIDSARRRVLGRGTDFFDRELWMEELPRDTVRIAYRRETKIPSMVAGIAHMSQTRLTDSAAAV